MSSSVLVSLLLGLLASLASINAQPGYTSSDGLWFVYPPAPYTYSSPSKFSPHGPHHTPSHNSFSSAAFTQIKTAGAKGQWGLSVYVDPGTGPAAGAWTKVVCNSSVYGACFNGNNNPPFDQPLSWGSAKINITYSYLKPSFVAAPWTNMQPSAVQFYLCYSDHAFNDRPWRKKNKAYPSLTNNCQGPDKVFNLLQAGPAPPATLPSPSASSIAFPTVANLSALTAAEKASLGGSISFNLKDNDQIGSATWFIMMWVWCSDGNVCAFESTEAVSTLNSSGLYYAQPYTGSSVYIQTDGYNGITSGMLAASIILGCLGPLAWILYIVADQMYYNKKGKVLQF